MADQDPNAGTNQNTGTDTGTLLTGGDANAGASDQQKGANTADPKAATSQTAEPDGQAAKEGEKKDEGKQPAAGAPEKYEFKMPDGITVDAKALEAFEPVARELNLSNEQAQKLVDLQAALQAETVKAQADQWANTTKAWKEEISADPEFGGKNLEATRNAAKAFLKQFGDEGLIKFLDDYGMGNHPALIRALAKAGKAMGEDNFKSGSTSVEDEDTLVARAQRMFPNSLKK